MDELGSEGVTGAQFPTEDPSDETDQIQLHATIDAILENTLDDNDDKAKDSHMTEDSPRKVLDGVENRISPVEAEAQEPSGSDEKSTEDESVETPAKENDNDCVNFEAISETSAFNDVSSTASSHATDGDLITATDAISSDQQHDSSTLENHQNTFEQQQVKGISLGLKHSPRKVSLSQECELIRKKKEMLESNDIYDLPLKKRGRPSSKPQNASGYLVCPLATENTDSESGKNDGPDLFLPEGWLFYASKRLLGITTGHFDQYYLTPGPTRVKLRSRQELLLWMNKNGRDWDINDFFQRKSVEPLIQKGVLKYISERIVIPASTEKVFFAENRHLTLDKSFAKVKQADLKEKCKLIKPKIRRKIKVKRRPVMQPEVKLEVKPAPVTEGKRKRGRPKRINCDSEQLNVQSSRASRLLRHSSPAKDQLFCKPLPIKAEPIKKSSPNRKHSVSSSMGSVECEDQFLKDQSLIVTRPSVISPSHASASEEQVVRIRKKPKIFKSPYFSLNDGLPEKPLSISALCRDRDDKDAPPRSPFNLIQEDLFHNPWQLLVSTIFLNCTSGKLAIPLATEFLSRWSTPQEVCRANIHDILDVVEPLGFGRIRAAQLIRFSYEFLTKDWKYPKELYGIGKYGNDSYKIFCLRSEWKRVDTDDPLLMMYLNWRRATEHLRKKFLTSPGDPTVIDPDDIPVQQQSNASGIPQLKKQLQSSVKRSSSNEHQFTSRRIIKRPRRS